MAFDNITRLYSTLSRRLDDLESDSFFLSQLVEELPIGLLFLNLEGEIRLSNHMARNLLGIPTLQGSYWDYFQEETFGVAIRPLLDSHVRCEQRILLQWKPDCMLELILKKESTGIVLLLQDRTESTLMEATLQHNQQLAALGTMAAQLAHEIRNPLGGIEGFASLLQNESLSTDQHDMVRSILSGCRALNQLVTDVLEYAKPLDLHFEPLDLVTLIREICQVSQGQAILHEEVSTFPLFADRYRLPWALLHLIRNGWEASHQPVCLYIREKELLIQDHGSGIPESVRPHLFTPFFSTKARGTGLGLTEAEKVVRAHGARLELRETSPNGTLFSVQWT